MISTVANFAPSVAAGILARAAFAIEDLVNPASAYRLPGESSIREAIFQEVRSSLGVARDDETPATLEKISDVIDKELDVLSATKDSDSVLKELAAKGEIPSDLYEVSIIPNVREIYAEKWYAEQDLIITTIRESDQEQHFGPESDEDKLALISLFSKTYSEKIPHNSFTMLVAAKRDGMALQVHQAWRIYEDEVKTKDAKDLIDLLRRFSNVFGVEFEVGGQKGKFILNLSLPDDIDAKQKIDVTASFAVDGRGRKIPKPMHFMLSNFTTKRSNKTISTSLTVALDIKKYKSSLKNHGW
ncbi:hypothetical protein [Polaromonas sp. P5_D5]